MTECKQCGRSFHADKPWQVFCDPKCRDRWHYEQRKNGGEFQQRKALRKATPEEREQATQGLAAIQASWKPGKFVRRI
jgi:hypothetical protein